MYGNFIIFKALLVFMVLHLAQAHDATLPRPTNQNSTKCFTCNSPRSCRSPAAVICDQKSANVTRSELAKHFLNVSNITNTTFECMHISYTQKNSVVLAISGCVNAGLLPCRLLPINVSLTTHVCSNCNKSLCNPSAGVSSSSVIIIHSILSLLLLKCLYILS